MPVGCHTRALSSKPGPSFLNTPLQSFAEKEAMEKEALPIFALTAPLAAYFAYQSAKALPEDVRNVREAMKQKKYKQALKHAGFTALDTAGLVPMGGWALGSVRKGAGAAAGALAARNAGNTGYTAMRQAAVENMPKENIKYIGEQLGKTKMAQGMQAAEEAAAKAANTPPAPGFWNTMWRGIKYPFQAVGKGYSHAQYSPIVASAKMAPGATQDYINAVNWASKTAPWKAMEWTANTGAYVLPHMGATLLTGKYRTPVEAPQGEQPMLTPEQQAYLRAMMSAGAGMQM